MIKGEIQIPLSIVEGNTQFPPGSKEMIITFKDSVPCNNTTGCGEVSTIQVHGGE
jgi:hypothetical protein